MTINPETLLGWTFPETEISYGDKDVMLYALGVGLGSDPTDPVELPFVYEQDLRVLPTMAAVLGHPGPWYADPVFGIDWVRVLHGEQALQLHRPLETQATLRCRTSVIDVEDKGPGKGALVRWRRELSDTRGQPVATLDSLLFCRGDGGFGGETRPRTVVPARPDEDPTHAVTTRVSTRAALLYRLSGDRNPVHADPATARAAGFDRPILHGLCTFAVAAWAILQRVGEGDPAALRSVRARFKSPVYPGDVLRTDMWRDGDDVRFQTVCPEREVVVLDAGAARCAQRRRTQ